MLSGRMAYQIAKERLTNPRPTTLREVPPSPDHLTNAWLTFALCDGTPGAEVVGFELTGRDDGTSSRRRLNVTYNDAGTAAGLPSKFFTKSGPTFKTRLVSAAADLSKIESNFYDRIRPQLDIEAPPARYAAYDPISNRQLLIVDDMAATAGAEFGTVCTRTLTREMAEDVVDTLAGMHIHFWQAPLQRMFGTWLSNSYDWQAKLNVTIGASKRILSGFERGSHVIPPRLYERRHEVPEAHMRSLEINVSGPQTFLHGDVHPGNWYVTSDGRMGLCDWQCMVQGGWARDIAYALASHLTPEQRREWERGLVNRYVDNLKEAGIEPPTDAFLEYRQQMPHAAFMWLATLGRHALQDELQPIDVVTELVRRITIAFDDLETLDAINERPARKAAGNV